MYIYGKIISRKFQFLWFPKLQIGNQQGSMTDIGYEIPRQPI